jgi:hypothetical protein
MQRVAFKKKNTDLLLRKLRITRENKRNSPSLYNLLVRYFRLSNATFSI